MFHEIGSSGANQRIHTLQARLIECAANAYGGIIYHILRLPFIVSERSAFYVGSRIRIGILITCIKLLISNHSVKLSPLLDKFIQQFNVLNNSQIYKNICRITLLGTSFIYLLGIEM